MVPRRRPLAAAGALLAAVLLLSHGGRAQPEGEVALARQYFKEGDDAAKKKDWPTALDRFQKALSIKETPQLHLRVGQAQERLGKLVDALVSYDRALEKATAMSLKDVAGVAREQIDAIKPRVPNVTITPKDDYPELAVSIDGATLAPATIGKKLPIDPGDHKLHVVAKGYAPHDEDFSLGEKQDKTIAFQLAADPGAGTAATATASTADAAPPPPRRSKVPAYALIGGGVVGVGVGAALFVVALGKDGTIDDECGGPDRAKCPISRQDAINAQIASVKTFELVGGIVGGVGALAAIGGVVLLATAPKDQPATTARRAGSAGPLRPAVSVAPRVGTSHGVVIVGRF